MAKPRSQVAEEAEQRRKDEAEGGGAGAGHLAMARSEAGARGLGTPTQPLQVGQSSGSSIIESLSELQKHVSEHKTQRPVTGGQSPRGPASGSLRVDTAGPTTEAPPSLQQAGQLLLSNEMLVTKGIVCSVLFTFVWAGVAVAVSEDGFSTECTDQRSLCSYKAFAVVLSSALLFPNLLEMGHAALLLVGDHVAPTGRLLETISKLSLLKYAVYGLARATVALFATTLLLVYLVVFGVPLRLMTARQDRADAGLAEKRRKFWATLSRAFAIWADSLLTWSLFPLSGFVIFSSNSVAEVITNLVAVQVFASLDDIVVQLLHSPQESVRSVVLLYMGRNRDKAQGVALSPTASMKMNPA